MGVLPFSHIRIIHMYMSIQCTQTHMQYRTQALEYWCLLLPAVTVKPQPQENALLITPSPVGVHGTVCTSAQRGGCQGYAQVRIGMSCRPRGD